jgi:RimJ/RimL family protein N-acetyltransferase
MTAANPEMMEAVKMGLGKLMAPPRPFKPYVPTPSKVEGLVEHLASGRLYVSDEFRDRNVLWRAATELFQGETVNIVYEVGPDAGILAFVNILVGWKCSLMFKLWDKGAWGPGFVKAGKKLVRDVMETCQLIRVDTVTPDLTMARLARMVGFHDEGVKEKSFKWDGTLYDETIMAIVRGE